MSDEPYVPNRVHLVGSVGLDTVQDVYRVCGTMLGERLKRIPDGEPGGRRLWCSWQAPLLRASPFFKLAPGQTGGIFGQLVLADGVKPEEVRFGELGYAREARTSYQDFLEAKEKGYIAPSTRFQVSLPTPVANLTGQFGAESYAVAEEPYTEAMLREVATICDAIPHEDLCIQWDVCIEMCMWDARGAFKWSQPGDAKTEIVRRLKRISDPVPADVELGFHLCYGDLDAVHFFDPEDAGAMVEIANAVSAAVDRPISYFHMPVPIARDDDAFFKPFDELNLKEGTDLFLGVVHSKDGVEGAKRRIAAAHAHVRDFGIGTECGMARARTPSVVTELLKIHAGASAAAS